MKEINFFFKSPFFFISKESAAKFDLPIAIAILRFFFTIIILLDEIDEA
jgi:hypothetical protein